MVISKSITLNGNNHIISGINKARIFHVTSGNVYLNNIQFINGWNSHYGGAIYTDANSASLLIVNNSFFTNNSAKDWGGAIYKEGSASTIVDNSIFINNSAGTWGGVFDCDTTGGLNTFDHCTFINNTCNGVGGAVAFCHQSGGYHSLINNSVFINNYAPTGSAIYSSSASLSNTFDNNWFGLNNPNWTIMTNGIVPKTWFVMNFTNITPITPSSTVATLLVSLDTIYNNITGNYTKNPNQLSNRKVTFNWTTGSVSPVTASVKNNVTTTFTHPVNMDYWMVNATIDDQTLYIGSTDLEIYIIPNKNPVDDGKNISFNITVINNGIMSAYDINISIIIPYGLINLNFTINNGTYNNTTNIWSINALHPKENFTITINGTLADPGPYLILNATIENNTGIYEPNLTNNNYSCIVNVTQYVDLEIHKNISNLHPQTKDNVTYTITVYNYGPSTATNVTVSDNLSNKLIYLNSNATKGYYNETSGIWFINNITPNTTEIINITVLVNKSGITSNFVNVTCPINDTNTTNNQDNISFETPPLSDLWIKITMEPQSSNYITYHIQAGNNGIEDANGTVAVFNLSNLYIYFNHTEDKGLYDNSTGVWDIGYLEVNETVNLTLIMRLDFPTGTTFANITTSVNITSWSTDLYPENNTDNISFEAEIFGNFRLLQDIVDSWPENTTQILPRSFAYDPIQDAKLPGETYDLINGVRLYKNITIINPYGFTLGGFNMARIFNISADNIVLDGLKFYDGYSPLGAALNIHADNIQILRSNFTHNWLFGDYGGAIFTSGKNTLIQDNLFVENSATKLGGAIGAVGAKNLKIINNTFINNTVESDEVFGGAVGIANSTATVNNNIFLDNWATNAPNLGTAIFTNNSNVNLNNNWFGNNTPDMTTDELIWGVKPETYIILDWEIVNPNITSIELNVVFL